MVLDIHAGARQIHAHFAGAGSRALAAEGVRGAVRGPAATAEGVALSLLPADRGGACSMWAQGVRPHLQLPLWQPL